MDLPEYRLRVRRVLARAGPHVGTASERIAISTSVAALGPFVFYRLSKGLWLSIVFFGEGLYIPWPNRSALRETTPASRSKVLSG